MAWDAIQEKQEDTLLKELVTPVQEGVTVTQPQPEAANNVQIKDSLFIEEPPASLIVNQVRKNIRLCKFHEGGS